jgi:serine/threonine-protein phosphatase 2A regulatory subunit B'
MFKSMKQKLGGGTTKKEAAGGPSTSKKDGEVKDAPSSAKQQAVARQPAPQREKPALPVISADTLAKFYDQPLPSFRDVLPHEKQYLFVQKLHLCSFTFDFTDSTKQLREKEMKRQTLLELVDYANSGSGKFTEAVSEDIVFMLSHNLFRSLPPPRSHEVDTFDAEEEEPSLDPSWPHLQVGPSCLKLRPCMAASGAGRPCTCRTCCRAVCAPPAPASQPSCPPVPPCALPADCV